MRLPGVSQSELKGYVKRYNRVKRLKGLKALNHYFMAPDELIEQGMMPKLQGKPGKHHGMQPGNPNRKRKLARRSRKRNLLK